MNEEHVIVDCNLSDYRTNSGAEVYEVPSPAVGLSEMQSLVNTGKSGTENSLTPVEIQRVAQEFAIQRIRHELEQIIIKTKIMDTITKKLGRTIDKMVQEDAEDDPKFFNVWLRAQEALLRSMEFSEKLLAPQGGLFTQILTDVSDPSGEDLSSEAAFLKGVTTSAGRRKIAAAAEHLLKTLPLED